MAAVWLVERRLDLRPLGFALLGTLLGLLVNPYFPDNLVFAYRHILPKLLGATAISVGNEWYPYTTGQLLKNSPLALAAFLSGGLALGLSGRRMDVRTATSFLATALFGLMLFQSRRFIEYFPAFALIFAAFAWAPLLISAAQEPVLPQKPQPGWRISSPAGLLGILLLLGLGLTLPAARESLRGSKPYSLYAGASAWLKANTPAGARLFQTDWDDFPRLFFYNTHNTYLVGLDPTYLQLADPALYSEWVEITQGKIDQPSAAIRDRFEARWVLTDQEHGAFLHAAAQDPSLEEVYRDSQAVVFRVTKSPDKP